MGLSNFSVELRCKGIVDALYNNYLKSSFIQGILDDTRDWLGHLNVIGLSYTHRSCNDVVHSLAKWALTNGANDLVLESMLIMCGMFESDFRV